jgi:hypothetical protein
MTIEESGDQWYAAAKRAERVKDAGIGVALGLTAVTAEFAGVPSAIAMPAVAGTLGALAARPIAWGLPLKETFKKFALYSSAVVACAALARNCETEGRDFPSKSVPVTQQTAATQPAGLIAPAPELLMCR